MNLSHFLENLNTKPKSINFTDTISVIEQHYYFTETNFKNGDLENAAGQNNGSCKIFAFAWLNNFNEQQTLECFGDYYRHDVLSKPDGTDHQNIRNFMKYGWSGIRFEGDALITR